jgi:hypothetical protein
MKAKVKKEHMVTVSVYLPQNVAGRLVEKATDEKRSVSQMAAIFIEDKLKESAA